MRELKGVRRETHRARGLSDRGSDNRRVTFKKYAATGVNILRDALSDSELSSK
jgi:hypothetical protein